MTLAHKGGAGKAIAQVFEADCLGAPFAVYLHDSVEFEPASQMGGKPKYTIPNVKELLLLILIVRVTQDQKLSGAEIKFIRKIIGLKQRDLAKKLEISVEHLSRHENGLPMTSQGEKFFRTVALREAAKFPELPKSTKDQKVAAALEAIFERMQIRPVVDADQRLEMHFRRAERAVNCGNDCGAWDERSAA